MATNEAVQAKVVEYLDAAQDMTDGAVFLSYEDANQRMAVGSVEGDEAKVFLFSVQLGEMAARAISLGLSGNEFVLAARRAYHSEMKNWMDKH